VISFTGKGSPHLGDKLGWSAPEYAVIQAQFFFLVAQPSGGQLKIPVDKAVIGTLSYA
jgi:hypothetical protein